MFHKIIKRGQRKFSKLEVSEATVYGYGMPDTVNVTVNHASRAADPGSPKVNSPPLAMALSAAGVIELLPLLKDAPPPERPLLFSRKLQICCASFDFSSTLKSIREKEIKRQTLLELVDIVQSGSFKLSESMQQELVWMISVNIFRCFPPAPHENTPSEAVDPDEEDQYSEPSWPHLQLVYELLLRYVVSPNTDIKMAKRYLDHLFVLKLLELFDSEDPREREYLKAILHRTYGKFMVLRPFIRQAINNVFYRFIFETERHRGIGELLEVLGSIINGFALPMKQEHKLFLARALMPLHKPKMISSYHQQLSYCVVQFVEKDSQLAEIVIKRLLKYWPMTNCQKEVLFLGELEEVLEATQSAEFQSCMVPLFRQIGRCLNSPHFQVAERALFFWNNEHLVSLIAQNRNVILPIIFEPLEQNLRGHWSQAVHGLTINVQKMFMEMDMELFEACQIRHSEREAQARESEARRDTAWRWMEDVVASQGRSAGDTVMAV